MLLLPHLQSALPLKFKILFYFYFKTIVSEETFRFSLHLGTCYAPYLEQYQAQQPPSLRSFQTPHVEETPAPSFRTWGPFYRREYGASPAGSRPLFGRCRIPPGSHAGG